MFVTTPSAANVRLAQETLTSVEEQLSDFQGKVEQRFGDKTLPHVSAALMAEHQPLLMLKARADANSHWHRLFARILDKGSPSHAQIKYKQIQASARLARELNDIKTVPSLIARRTRIEALSVLMQKRFMAPEVLQKLPAEYEWAKSQLITEDDMARCLAEVRREFPREAQDSEERLGRQFYRLIEEEQQELDANPPSEYLKKLHASRKGKKVVRDFQFMPHLLGMHAKLILLREMMESLDAAPLEREFNLPELPPIYDDVMKEIVEQKRKKYQAGIMEGCEDWSPHERIVMLKNEFRYLQHENMGITPPARLKKLYERKQRLDDAAEKRNEFSLSCRAEHWRDKYNLISREEARVRIGVHNHDINLLHATHAELKALEWQVASAIDGIQNPSVLRSTYDAVVNFIQSYVGNNDVGDGGAQREYTEDEITQLDAQLRQILNDIMDIEEEIVLPPPQREPDCREGGWRERLRRLPMAGSKTLGEKLEKIAGMAERLARSPAPMRNAIAVILRRLSNAVNGEPRTPNGS